MLSLKNIKIKGISLLEVMLSLSIIAIILVMATRYFLVASEGQKTNTVKRDAAAIVAAIQSYKSSGSYIDNQGFSNITMQVLVTDGYLQGVFHSATPANPWQQPFQLSKADKANAVTLSTLLPKSACDALRGAFYQSDAATNCSGKSTMVTFNYCIGGTAGTTGTCA